LKWKLNWFRKKLQNIFVFLRLFLPWYISQILLPVSETFRLVSTFLFSYIILYRRSRNCKSTSTLPTSRLATLPRLLSDGAPQMYLGIAQLSLRLHAKTGRNVSPLITDNESNIDVILNRLISSPIPPSLSPLPRARTATNCRHRNINIYHKITFLATAHFITHIAAIFTQDTRMNYYVYLERAPIKRNRAPSRRYWPCRQVSLKRFCNISGCREISSFLQEYYSQYTRVLVNKWNLKNKNTLPS